MSRKWRSWWNRCGIHRKPCSQNSPPWSSKPKCNPLPKAEPFQPDFAHKYATDKLQQKLKSDKFRTIKKGVPQWSFFLPCGTPWCVKSSVILLFPLFYGAIFSISSFSLFTSWFNPFHFNFPNKNGSFVFQSHRKIKALKHGCCTTAFFFCRRAADNKQIFSFLNFINISLL